LMGVKREKLQAPFLAHEKGEKREKEATVFSSSRKRVAEERKGVVQDQIFVDDGQRRKNGVGFGRLKRGKQRDEMKRKGDTASSLPLYLRPLAKGKGTSFQQGPPKKEGREKSFLRSFSHSEEERKKTIGPRPLEGRSRGRIGHTACFFPLITREKKKKCALSRIGEAAGRERGEKKGGSITRSNSFSFLKREKGGGRSTATHLN